MKSQIDMLAPLCSSLPLLLDRHIQKPYESMQQRLIAMSVNSEFAGYIEILAVAYIIKRPVHVFTKIDKAVRLIAKLPCDHFSDQQPILLLHEYDYPNHPGHFNVLLENETKDDFFSQEIFTDWTNACCNDRSERPAFRDLLEFANNPGYRISSQILLIRRRIFMVRFFPRFYN